MSEVTIKVAQDQSTRLISVKFRREMLNDPDQRDVEVIYELFWPDDMYEAPQIVTCLELLSVTHLDTRIPVKLERIELNNARDSAMQQAATECEDW